MMGDKEKRQYWNDADFVPPELDVFNPDHQAKRDSVRLQIIRVAGEIPERIQSVLNGQVEFAYDNDKDPSIVFYMNMKLHARDFKSRMVFVLCANVPCVNLPADFKVHCSDCDVLMSGRMVGKSDYKFDCRGPPPATANLRQPLGDGQMPLMANLAPPINVGQLFPVEPADPYHHFNYNPYNQVPQHPAQLLQSIHAQQFPPQIFPNQQARAPITVPWPAGNQQAQLNQNFGLPAPRAAPLQSSSTGFQLPLGFPPFHGGSSIRPSQGEHTVGSGLFQPGDTGSLTGFPQNDRSLIGPFQSSGMDESMFGPFQNSGQPPAFSRDSSPPKSSHVSTTTGTGEGSGFSNWSLQNQYPANFKDVAMNDMDSPGHDPAFSGDREHSWAFLHARNPDPPSSPTASIASEASSRAFSIDSNESELGEDGIKKKKKKKSRSGAAANRKLMEEIQKLKQQNGEAP